MALRVLCGKKGSVWPEWLRVGRKLFEALEGFVRPGRLSFVRKALCGKKSSVWPGRLYVARKGK